MQTANVYAVYQTVSVQLVGDFNVRTRNRQLYSENIKLYKGVDNPVRLLVKNQDQKPVDISSIGIVADLIDRYTNTVIGSYSAVKTNAAKGICEITVAASDLDATESRFYYLTVKKTKVGQDDQIAYVDDNYNVRLPVEVFDAYLPYNPTSLDLGEVADSNIQTLTDLGSLS